MIYADLNFYQNEYLRTGKPNIPGVEFNYWAMLASAEIRQRTFGNLEQLTEILEDVSMCCCEVAEKLYLVEAAKDENGMILQSFGNDGETGTYKTSDFSESAVCRSITRIVKKWLAHTGYMYCGVD